MHDLRYNLRHDKPYLKLYQRNLVTVMGLRIGTRKRQVTIFSTQTKAEILTVVLAGNEMSNSVNPFLANIRYLPRAPPADNGDDIGKVRGGGVYMRSNHASKLFLKARENN